MSILHRKLFRELWLLRGPALAIGLVMASGVATFIMSLCVLSTLYHTQSVYYERYRFADIFLQVKRAPESLARRLAEIPGVLHVETRIMEFVNLDLPMMVEPATGRLLSLPDHGEPALNRLHLTLGRWPELDRVDEVLVSDGFATAHHLLPGDRVGAILNGRLQHLKIVGVAMSPEFIYQIREGDILPDDRRFGIFWMRRRSLEAAFQMEGAFNDAALAVGPGVDEAFVIGQADRLTESYGGTGAYGRDEQPSHKFVSNEINELRGMARIVPSIFLLVAAWLIQVVISRLIGAQREQIATLKAFGYTSFEIGQHYLELVALIAALGTGFGVGIGVWMGHGVASLYTHFLHFPSLEFRLDVSVALAALAASLLSSLLAVLRPVWLAVRLPPAVAMRPEVPPTFGTTWIESLRFVKKSPIEVRMIFRQIVRRPLRAAVMCLGLSLAVAILILGRFMLDGLNYVLESEFTVAQRQDMILTFVEPTSGRVVADVAHLPGVLSVEPFRAVPVRMRSDYRSRRLGLQGLSTDARLFRVSDVRRNVLVMPEDGLIISKYLADYLKVRPGDEVVVEVLEGRRPVRPLRLAGVVSDFKGESAYASLSMVHRLMQEENAVSGVFLTADSARLDDLYRELKQTPRLSAASLKGSALQSLRDTIVANIVRMRAFNITFACIIACGVVYNSARIALAERSRELATLRVIGLTRGEVSRILLGELAALTLVAIPMGLGIGYLLADFVIRTAYDTELFRIPLITTRATYAFAALVTLLATLGTGLLVARRVARLDLVAVLKTRE